MKKTQKVEIEIKSFDGFEFDGYRQLKLPDDMNSYVFFDCPEDEDHLNPIRGTPLSAKYKYFIYKKKPIRKIIFEEGRFGDPKFGDTYIDDNGNIIKCVGPIQFSGGKRQILAKIIDDFEVNND